MQIDPEFVNCVGFIGVPTERGFAADGTCFIVGVREETETFLYMVTARHLVRPIRFGVETEPVDSIVHVRLSRQTKPPRILDTIRSEWFCHADRHVDLCVRPLDLRGTDSDGDLDFGVINIGDNDRSLLLTPKKETYFGSITVGDDIFIPSLFTGHVGERRNIPVLRVGNIAALPVESIRVGAPTVPAYLIETRSLGGISGAPVFLHLQPQRARNVPRFTDEDGRRTVPYALIGIVLGAHSGRYAADFVESNQDENIIATDADFNAGISVVLPIRHVTELLLSDSMKAERVATLEAIKKESGDQ